jgi:hypothetical protein
MYRSFSGYKSNLEDNLDLKDDSWPQGFATLADPADVSLE